MSKLVRETMDTVEAAEFLGISHRTLNTWRSTGRVVIPFVKLGRKVVYRLSDLMAFMDRQCVGGTTDTEAI